MMNKNCTKCKQPFNVYDEDLDYLANVSPDLNGEKHSIPAPKLCF
jgi:hypothetical protein